jgi:lipooligosaccharide transport system ATP-binding protein
MSETVVVAENLVKKFGDFTAVKGVSFSVVNGECFGLLGPNGAGKTSVARMIYGLSPVTAGRLDVFGQNVMTASRKIKANIGVVPQEDNLDPELTVRDNLLIYASYFRMPKDLAKSRAAEIMRFMDLEDKAEAVVEQLSGGLKRRLTIGRAMLNQPKMLILDEPTTGLDPYARHLVWQRLKGLKDAGTTMLLTTHYLEEADQLCDRLIIFYQGEILEQGKPKELVERHTGVDAIELDVATHQLDKLLAGCEDLIKDRRKRGEYLNPKGISKDNSYPIAPRTSHLESREELILFTNQGQALADRLNSRSVELAITMRYQRLRPANLEDVFLKLTGATFAEQTRDDGTFDLRSG